MTDQDVGKPDQPVSQLKMESKATSIALPQQPSLERQDVSSKPQSKWNTKNLFYRLGADVVSAGAAASLLAPLISIIDR